MVQMKVTKTHEIYRKVNIIKEKWKQNEGKVKNIFKQLKMFSALHILCCLKSIEINQVKKNFKLSVRTEAIQICKIIKKRP